MCVCFFSLSVFHSHDNDDNDNGQLMTKTTNRHGGNDDVHHQHQHGVDTQWLRRQTLYWIIFILILFWGFCQRGKPHLCVCVYERETDRFRAKIYWIYFITSGRIKVHGAVAAAAAADVVDIYLVKQSKYVLYEMRVLLK